MTRRPRWRTLLAATAAAGSLLAGTTAAAAAPRVPAGLPTEAEPLAARYQPPTTCGAPQPGTLAVAQLIRDAYGRQTIGTARDCPATGVPVSEHSDGRALDWMLNAADPAQAALAREFLTWLLADDARAARRLGVMYVIWDRQVWKAYAAGAGWQPYTGPNPHTDHVHLSLTFSGAARETSWWTGTTDPLRGHWIALGAERSALGGDVGGTRTTNSAGVARKDFHHGTVYSSPTTPVREVHGAIRARFDALGGVGVLGVPLTDELRTPRRPGAYNHFQHGSVYWSPATGAHAVRGAIRDRWAALGWENGIGFPTTGDARTPVRFGYYTHFEGGSVYWSPATGAHAVRGALREAWARQGWENGPLGFPTTDEFGVPGGLRLEFQGGSITWDAARRTTSTSLHR
ncbi:LGFP repeat-containing protein [Kineococcus sp. SYSU DK001]|uniref:LGFP repeat-containing protein n=1 Tax=Kineococcus sp. SYSU DK001 TaxID=3383122 RepID=UPI003D7D8DD1